MGIPGFSTVGSAASTASPRRSGACLVCGLIQRKGYTGKDCEMCASSLMLAMTANSSGESSLSTSTPRVAYTRVNLSGSSNISSSGGGSSGTVVLTSSTSSTSPTYPISTAALTPSFYYSSSLKSLGPSGHAVCPYSSPLDKNMKCGGVSSAGGGVSCGTKSTVAGNSVDCEKEIGGSDGVVDWHFLVKRLAEEKRIAAGWGSLHHGWLWLQRALQVQGCAVLHCCVNQRHGSLSLYKRLRGAARASLDFLRTASSEYFAFFFIFLVVSSEAEHAVDISFLWGGLLL